MNGSKSEMKDRIARIFYNQEELRIRAGWRILLFMAILIGLGFALQSLIELTVGDPPEDKTLKMLVAIAMVTRNARFHAAFAVLYMLIQLGWLFGLRQAIS